VIDGSSLSSATPNVTDMATILIIDDDPGSRELFAVLARSVGHDVMTATDGERPLSWPSDIARMSWCPMC
jgi:CheY-like chemotaxis protein